MSFARGASGSDPPVPLTNATCCDHQSLMPLPSTKWTRRSGSTNDCLRISARTDGNETNRLALPAPSPSAIWLGSLCSLSPARAPGERSLSHLEKGRTVFHKRCWKLQVGTSVPHVISKYHPRTVRHIMQRQQLNVTHRSKRRTAARLAESLQMLEESIERPGMQR